MILAVLIFGVLLIDVGMKNTGGELATQLQDDLLGQDGFIAWGGAIMGLGAIGYVPSLQHTSRLLLGLVFVVLILRIGGVFANAQAALTAASTTGPAPAVPIQTPAQTAPSGASSGSSSGGGGLGSIIGGIAGSALGKVIGGL